MNSQVFDIRRFSKLFVHEFYRFRSKLLGIVAVFFGIFVLTVIYSYVFNTAPIRFSFVALGVAFSVLAPIFFNKNINKISAIFDFTLPASTFEKFLVKWTCCVLVIPLYICAFLLLIAGLYCIMPGGLCVDTGYRILSAFSHASFEQLMFYAALQSIFMVGTYYFRKHVFLKVCFSLIIYFLLFAVIFIFTHKYLFNEGAQNINLNFNLFGDSENNNLFMASNNATAIILNIIAPLGFWVVSFLKLRETEI